MKNKNYHILKNYYKYLYKTLVLDKIYLFAYSYRDQLYLKSMATSLFAAVQKSQYAMEYLRSNSDSQFTNSYCVTKWGINKHSFFRLLDAECADIVSGLLKLETEIVGDVSA